MKSIFSNLAGLSLLVLCLVLGWHLSELLGRTNYGFSHAKIGIETALLFYIVGCLALITSFMSYRFGLNSRKIYLVGFVVSGGMIFIFSLLVALGAVILR